MLIGRTLSVVFYSARIFLLSLGYVFSGWRSSVVTPLRVSRLLPSTSQRKQTPNAQHRTSNIEVETVLIGRSTLGVGRSMFALTAASPPVAERILSQPRHCPVLCLHLCLSSPKGGRGGGADEYSTSRDGGLGRLVAVKI